MNLFAAVQRRLAPETKRLSDGECARLYEWVQRNIRLPRSLLIGVIVGIVVCGVASLFVSRWLALGSGMQTWHGLAIPGISFAPMWVFFFFVHRERRRWVRRGMNALGHPTCVGCGYDLSGIDDERCPECGAAREVAQGEPGA